MKTQVYKSINGWTAETQIDIPDVGENFVLRIATSKWGKGTVVTNASVSKRDGYFLSHRLYEDYSKVILSEVTRCTEKTVRSQHASVTGMVEAVIGAVREHYAKEAA